MHKNVHIKIFKKHQNFGPGCTIFRIFHVIKMGFFWGFFKVQDILIVDMKPCFISTKIFLKQTLGYKLIFSSLIKVNNLYSSLIKLKAFSIGFYPILKMRTKKFQCATWLSIAHQCAHMRTLLVTLCLSNKMIYMWLSCLGTLFQKRSISIY